MNGGIFSTGYEQKLLEQNLKAFSAFLEYYNKPKSKILGLITAQEVQDELGVKWKTLQRWERAGLKRYQPPLEDTRKVFYKITDVLIFLGVDTA
ncbi:hypothetical protein GGG87_02320 [Streptococcus sp. zg-86]|uniref:XRE family transcriptional regulator n=1 Tax=Streptococcus zhangguiae TaxID=2664091 RepID=A0A6I4RDF1_9STRE|nr:MULTISPECIES: hypothetical protein [unclassified Streptococcus]MTB63848.1 hypothetical protein [Streptococcus sp. zg-86]MTB90158.1 hypothetical protein [Streptococcus sp. zg-36]MWV55830.1 hypothetical protein [Streptococcus sp. zg-70]QTH47888.1 hypothetical protein J5M87_00680 [Streptococcus sp. zg-86]